MDRGQRRPPRRRRVRERRRPAAEPAARQCEPAAHQAPGRERGARSPSFERARLVADPGARASGRARAVESADTATSTSAAADVSEKQANRRIRLLLAVFALLFAGDARARGWLQVVNAAQLSRIAERQHQRDRHVPAWRGTIFDRTGVRPRDRRADDHRVRRPDRGSQPRAVAIAAGSCSVSIANTLYPQLLNKKSRFIYVQRFGRSRPGREADRRRTSPASAPIPRRSARTRRGRSARRSSASPGRGQQGPRRARAARTTTALGAPRLQTRWTIRSAVRSTSSSRAPCARARTCTRPSTTRSRRTPSRCCARPSPTGMRRTRARSCSIRRRAPFSRWPRRPATTRTTRATSRSTLQRNRASPTRTSRARPSSSSPSRRAPVGHRHAVDEVPAAVLDPGRRPVIHDAEPRRPSG